jgi:nucleotidyltransferase substrate binding protein (TIGR01987 family)
MEQNVRWKERFVSYCKALLQLEEGLQQKNFSVLEKDGIIKWFEFTFELAWKTLQDLLSDRGYLDIKGPKPVIKQAFHDEIISDGQAWIDMLNDRNKSSHLYDETSARGIFDKIQIEYLKLLTDLKIILQNDE